jgi:SAM-dependent methyltransferase
MIEAFSMMGSAEADRFMLGKEHPALRTHVASLIGSRRVFDLGCGKGFMVKDLYTVDQYFGIDVSAELIRIAMTNNPGYKFHQQNLASGPITVDSGSVEVALMISVMEHLPDLETAQYVYSEATRISKELLIVWHTPPIYESTDLIEVQAELDRPLSQNHYARGSFDREDLDVRVGLVAGFECWRVTHR